ncbi:MAG: tRNA epoxyqueuosine(34) reductase QueG [Bacteroidota bacterium]|nr:tRNA epoxyqueuosine(34) reductase QueG [Bacteroidota bacterium]
MHQDTENITAFIKAQALEMGFIACGIAKADYLDNHADRYNEWIKNGYHANMDYMARNAEKRSDPTKLVSNAKSVISLLYNYYPEKTLPEKDNYHIAKYAYGKDYHEIIKKKLWELLQKIEEKTDTTSSRVFIDTAPVLERAWAEKAGLGWIGKNSMLINKTHGSFFLIGEIITDLELNYDTPVRNLCGNCTKCIDACPTNAIIKEGVIDSNKCISFWTIENREEIPEKFKDIFKDNFFGCDICQDVCPWNKFSSPHNEEAFRPHADLFTMNKEKWGTLTEEQYRELFKKSAVKRAKYKGVIRNIKFLESKK